MFRVMPFEPLMELLYHGLYLGIFIVRSRNFKCSLTNAKKSFYRSANAIFGKIGRIAPEETILELISSKCIPVLIYGLEACPLLKSDLSSLDFVVNRFFMKLFRTNSIDIVKQCQYHFGFPFILTTYSLAIHHLWHWMASNVLMCR